MNLVGNFATLPVVIDGPGVYFTRDGRRAKVDTIDPRPNMLSNGFAAKGSIERMFRGKMKFHGFRVWHISGCSEGLHQRPSDIVAKAT